METWPGASYPLGATFDGNGTNFAIFSEGAERVELCLIGDRGKETRIELVDVDAFVWHTYIPNVAPGQRYALPRARRLRPGIRQAVQSRASCSSTRTRRRWRARSSGARPSTGTTFGDPDSRNDEDSAGHTMLGVVINPFFDWAGDRQPKTPYASSFIYEAHVKGMTARPPRRAGGAPRHVRRDRASGDHRPPHEARRHRDRADARPPVRQRRDAPGEGPVELLGLQHASPTSRRRTRTRRRASAASRCRSSRGWCGRCTGPGSR